MKSLKVLLVCLAIFTLTSCSSNEDLNRAPNDFSITLGRVDGGNMGVTWSEAVDPDGDTVTYDVYVDDLLKTSNLSVREAVVKFSGQKSIIIKIIAKDANGATVTAIAIKNQEV